MAKTLEFRQLPGQNRARTVLTAAFNAEQMAHAYLFTGPSGSGKFVAALELAMAILCDADIGPCGVCESCRMVLANNHPDFRCVFPIQIEKNLKASNGELNEEGWNAVRSMLQERIDNPWALVETPSTVNIPVDWIRDLNNSIMRGPVRGRNNVAIVCDVDHMHTSAANAMLKTLEEPPAGAVIILLSALPQGVLQTTRSRCQTIRFGIVGDEEMRSFISKRSGLAADHPSVSIAVAGGEGSPGKALSMLSTELDPALQTAEQFLSICFTKTPTLSAMKTLESIAAVSEEQGSGFMERHFAACSRQIREQVVCSTGIKVCGTKISGAFNASDPSLVSAVFDACERGTHQARARTGTLLILADSYLTISETIHDSK